MKKRHIAVVGLGYVGLSIAAAFGKQGKVIGYDKNPERINELKKGVDRNKELTPQELKSSDIQYTSNPDDLNNADFYISTVLTPIDKTHHPDLTILLEATALIGKYLKKNDIIVYESTVYPGATEEKCIPILEKISGLKCGRDFQVGYSPERVNPSDKQHTFYNIKKIVSATDEKSLEIISDVYRTVVTAGVHPVSCIRVAEATKVIENTQRDLNISVINEIAIILHAIGMETPEIIEATKTKWNYNPAKPGLVGGHCIGINSYYLTNKAEEAGYHSHIISAGREINEFIPKFIADETIKKLISLGVLIKGAKIGILGLTYKENCPDIHDSRVIDIINELKSFNTDIIVHDPIANPEIVKKDLNISLQSLETLKNLDAIIISVSHDQYVHANKKMLADLLKPGRIIMDVKGILNPDDFKDMDVNIWRL